MRKFKYIGDQPVDVPALAITVEPGQVIEVVEPDVSAGLDGQEQWEHVPDPERSRAAKKAAETRADNDSQEG